MHSIISIYLFNIASYFSPAVCYQLFQRNMGCPGPECVSDYEDSCAASYLRDRLCLDRAR